MSFSKNEISEYIYKQTKKLSTGEIKEYTYKKKYIKKGSKFNNFRIKYNDIIKDKTLRPMDKVDKIMKLLTDKEKEQFTKKQIANLIYRDI